MDQGVQKLLNQISDLESKNRLIHIQIEELKTTEKELQKNEKELILEIENICKQIKCMEKEEIELNNDISRVHLICKNVEATLHNEFVKVEIAAQKINQIEYYEEKDKNINTDLVKCDDKVKECLIKMNTADNNSLTMLKEMKDKNFLVSQVSVEDLCEIYETHLLIEKIRGSNNDPYFNLANIANYYGLNEEKKDTKMENFGLSELNKIMINHYKSKKINVNNGI
ncbi:conserved Plasmodium protein, unknown function [Plasmodium ovale wallikeri]|uniref:Uncharacterized protein n=1 Tax=Plasmodium ovale wallikeri TaxID=864142 RepID=A0A1A8ZYJ4_PLAOA|nr:conserved Plasmodium protein, unknown function [Plasmodium ovale wallikeri]SBT49345.1 conserved Plasmodium protein, unknown function [Plasmodium ovale wallikeri]